MKFSGTKREAKSGGEAELKRWRKKKKKILRKKIVAKKLKGKQALPFRLKCSKMYMKA